MFYYLSGKVALIDLNLVVIDCGGVGFSVNTTTTTMAQLKKGEETLLYTHCAIREDAFDIYGFATRREMETFKLLIAVSGVGPKAALSILSTLTPDGFHMAVVTQNEKAITAAPGVGKKIAQRIILELKDKVDYLPTDEEGESKPAPSARNEEKEIAAQALVSLGYSRTEAAQALEKVTDEGLDSEGYIKQALRHML